MASTMTRPRGEVRKLEVSRFDRVSSALWALIIIFAILASLVVLMWLGMREQKAKQTAVATVSKPIQEIGPLGIGEDQEDPGVEDFYEVETSQLADAVEALTNLPTTMRSLLANVDGDSPQMGKGRGLGNRRGGRPPTGNAERWSIEYESDRYRTYLDQLSFFGIEIGFVSKTTERVELVSNLNATPQVRPTTKEAESRAYFVHQNAKLRNWDLRLGVEVGVKVGDKIPVQFYSNSVMGRLEQLENAELARRNLTVPQVKRTLFKVRPNGSDYEYYVADVIPK
jgi:hypothetical protein